tara:strand:+ start:1065 stop:2336 length:1272 start_codon:yes stop_codon:yes gene_type:complete
MQRNPNNPNIDISAVQPEGLNTDTMDPEAISKLIEQAKSRLDNITRNVNGHSPLERAQTRRNHPLLNEYYQLAEQEYQRADGKGPNTSRIDQVKHGRTILFWAIACFQSSGVVSSLINLGSNPEEEIYHDDMLKPFSPLFYAISLGNTEAVRAILSHNPELTMQENEYGATPAHYATELRAINVLEVMFEFNKKVARIRTGSELTPLHMAVEARHDDIVAWLATHDHHAEDEPSVCNIGNRNQFTPLHLAVDNNQASTVAVLLKHGADYRLVTGPHASSANKTPLQMAADAKSCDIMRLIIQHGAATDPHLKIALDVLDYIDRRVKQPQHKRTVLGYTNIFGYDLMYDVNDKISACKALIQNIVKGDEDPLSNLTSNQRGALRQGELRDVVLPLIEVHALLTRDPSPDNSLRTSPSLNSGNSN